jgi:hypothetical protein
LKPLEETSAGGAGEELERAAELLSRERPYPVKDEVLAHRRA